MDKDKWIKRWKCWIVPTRVPGVWKRKEGGHLVRARVVDPTTGRMKEIKRVLPEADLATAYKWLEDERGRVRAGVDLEQRPKLRFADYASSLLKRKIETGDIRSPKSQERWRHTLAHLITGTALADGQMSVGGLGELFMDQIRAEHVETWKVGIVQLINGGHYSPHTANGWLSVLRVIDRAAKRDLRLAVSFTEGVRDFDTSDHVTYSEESPNALAPEMLPVFLAALREMFPQHYAMTYLGFATGLRPSSLRPLRRSGLTPDVLWEQKRLLVRRSQTIGKRVLNSTKQKTRYAIDLPEEVMDVLRWHVETQLTEPEQQDSELLFPSITGGFRSPTVLNKPFADVSDAIELGYRFTQKGMRRTFNDLARAAKVEALVTRSISGHLTERMQHHYSTVRPDEQRASIAKVIGLFRSIRQDAGSSAHPNWAEHGTTPGVSTAAAASGGAPSGAPTLKGGAPNSETD
jgi:integrase